MRVFYDKDNKVNFDQINEKDTVQDLLDAVDVFLDSNPLPCQQCEESCCKKSWSVEMDNVCVNRLCRGNAEDAVKFVDTHLVKRKNYYRDFFQLVLKKENDCTFISCDNRCSIYADRPVICRLYLCCDKSLRYNILRELIGSTYLRALVLEHRMNSHSYTERTINKYKKNPVLFARNYDIAIGDILKYSDEEGWLDEDERQLLTGSYT